MVAIIGVDPHKHVLSAVALDERGGLLGHWHGELSERGIGALQTWAVERAPAATWAIESSNSLGRRLALVLTSAGADVRDVCPTRTADRRRQRPGRGKSDVVDAEAIARNSWLIPVCRMLSRALRRAYRIRAAKNWPCWCGRASSWWIGTGAC